MKYSKLTPLTLMVSFFLCLVVQASDSNLDGVAKSPEPRDLPLGFQQVISSPAAHERVCEYVDLTPLPGSTLREHVLDALRREVKRIHGLDVVFVVRHLRVKDGWAWAHTLPQSPDGTNRFEDLSALLRIQDGAWKVVEIPCGEAENPECLNGPEYFKGLQERYPTVAVDIFPDWARVTLD